MDSLFPILAALVIGSCASTSAIAEHILCQGEASGHLQGFDSDGQFIYWSMYTKLIKTDRTGRVVVERDVDPHHGDCCVHDGQLYVATENRTPAKRGLFVNAYHCGDLSLAAEYPIAFPEGGIDGIAFADGYFYVGQGKPKESEQDFNWVHKFTPDFTPVETIKVPGQTAYGIQTITFAHGFFWLGTYSEKRTYQCDPQLNILAFHNLDLSVGAFALPKGPNGEIRLMVARNVKKENGRWTASAAPAVLHDGKLEWEK